MTCAPRKANGLIKTKTVASVYEFTCLSHLNPCNKTSRALHAGVLYGCGTWYLLLRKDRRLRVFKNKGAERDIWA